MRSEIIIYNSNKYKFKYNNYKLVIESDKKIVMELKINMNILDTIKKLIGIYNIITIPELDRLIFSKKYITLSDNKIKITQGLAGVILKLNKNNEIEDIEDPWIRFKRK